MIVLKKDSKRTNRDPYQPLPFLFSLFCFLFTFRPNCRLLYHTFETSMPSRKKRKNFQSKKFYFHLIFSMMISCPGLALIVTSLSFCLKIWQFGNEDLISSFVFLLGCQVWMETDHPTLVGLKLKRSASVPPEDPKFAGCRLHLLHLISSRSCKR